MKYFLIFVLSFAVLSILPFLWNHFSFVEVGFPFPYLQKRTFEGLTGSGMGISLLVVDLFYDLVVVAIVAWIITYLAPNKFSRR